MEKETIQKKITEIELAMNEADFWSDKVKAQSMI